LPLLTVVTNAISVHSLPAFWSAWFYLEWWWDCCIL